MGLEFAPDQAIHLGARGDDGFMWEFVVSPAKVGGWAESDEGGGAAGDGEMAEAAIGGDEEVEGVENAGHFGEFELGDEVYDGFFGEGFAVDFVPWATEHGDFVSLLDQVVDCSAEGFGGNEFLGPGSSGDDPNGCTLEGSLGFGEGIR